MSRTLSVLIVEDFVFNEGPKWDKFKRGVHKLHLSHHVRTWNPVGTGAGKGGTKISDANRNYGSVMKTSQSDNNEKNPYDRELAANALARDKKITDRRDNQHATGNKGAAGLAAGSLLAGAYAVGAKNERKKQEKKSLKERLELVKSGMFLNEESADITALRNKISQGLILLPGLKGSAVDKMEDAIRSWEYQINKLKNKIGEKYE